MDVDPSIRAYLLVVALVLAGSAASHADVIYVPGDHPTIQAAIDTSVDGDKIVVAPGSYFELIDFRGKTIALVSSHGPSNTTISGAGLDGSVVQCVGGETSETLLEGFTITGGTGTPHKPGRRGGGVYIHSSAPTIRNCFFVANEVIGRGGAIYVRNGHPHVERCAFWANTSTDHGAAVSIDGTAPTTTITRSDFIGNHGSELGGAIITEGGAIGIYGTPLLVEHCRFEDNQAYHGGAVSSDHADITILNCSFRNNAALTSGGGVSLRLSGTVLVRGCEFIGNSNSGGDTSAGGGIFISDDVVGEVSDCLFRDNYAPGAGGGLRNRGSTVAVSRCIFDNNTATWGGGLATHATSASITNCLFQSNHGMQVGGAILNYASSPPITNCTFVDNTNWWGPGKAIASNDGSHPTVVNSILWDGGNEIWLGGGSTTVITYSDVEGGYPGAGNLDVDPGFLVCGVLSGRLTPGSPCIDAGDNTAVPSNVEIDLAGRDRYVDDPETVDTGVGDPPIVDLGAMEFHGTCLSDLDGDGQVGFTDLTQLLVAWHQIAGDVTCDGTTGIADLLAILSAWGPCE